MVLWRSKSDPCTSENAPSGIRDVETGKDELLLMLLVLEDEELEEEVEEEVEVEEVTFVEVIVEVPFALVDVLVAILKE